MLAYCVVLAGLSLAQGACQVKPEDRHKDKWFVSYCDDQDGYSLTKSRCVPAHARKRCPTYESCCDQGSRPVSCCWKDAKQLGFWDHLFKDLTLPQALILYIMLPVIIPVVLCCFVAWICLGASCCGIGATAALVSRPHTSSAYPQESVQMPQRVRIEPVPHASLALDASAPPQPAMAPMQSAMVPLQPEEEPHGKQFQVIVPADCAGGSTVMVDVPNGQQMPIVVPAGLQAGQVFFAEL